MKIIDWVKSWFAEPPPPYDGPPIYRLPFDLPGAPPIGRSVRTSTGLVFKRTNEPRELAGMFGQWGMWEGGNHSALNWFDVLLLGPVTLEPLTLKEKAEEKIYGPIGARWGNPDLPCPYYGCVLGAGHVNVHSDFAGQDLGVNLEPLRTAVSDAVTRADYETLCTCGSPGLHLDTCPRYIRIAGGNFFKENPHENG